MISYIVQQPLGIKAEHWQINRISNKNKLMKPSLLLKIPCFTNLTVGKTCAKWPCFYFLSIIWRHHRVPRPRFPIRWRNFGESATSKGQIAYFLLRMCQTAIFLLSVKNLTWPSCFSTKIFYEIQEFWRLGHNLKLDSLKESIRATVLAN